MHIIDSIGIGGGAESIVAGSITEMKNYEHSLVTLYRYHEEFKFE